MEVTLSDKVRCNFFQATVVLILLFGCTTWTLTKRIEKKLDVNCPRMLRAILNKSLKQHPTKKQLYGHLAPISKTIQIRRIRHAGNSWRSKYKLLSDVQHGRASVGRPLELPHHQICNLIFTPTADRIKIEISLFSALINIWQRNFVGYGLLAHAIYIVLLQL